MATDIKVMGLRGDASFDSIVAHFVSKGGDVVLMDPMYVCGKEQLFSAVEHAERAFANDTNSSKTLLTEIIMYASGERQISKALKKMKPKDGIDHYAAVLLNIDDPELQRIGMVQDDSILDANEEKARMMGLDVSMGLPIEDLALELVAMLDVTK